jgi:hypothetical protein
MNWSITCKAISHSHDIHSNKWLKRERFHGVVKLTCMYDSEKIMDMQLVPRANLCPLCAKQPTRFKTYYHFCWMLMFTHNKSMIENHFYLHVICRIRDFSRSDCNEESRRALCKICWLLTCKQDWLIFRAPLTGLRPWLKRLWLWLL